MNATIAQLLEAANQPALATTATLYGPVAGLAILLLLLGGLGYWRRRRVWREMAALRESVDRVQGELEKLVLARARSAAPAPTRSALRTIPNDPAE